MPGCKTSLKFSPNSLRMNRIGTGEGLQTAIEFEKGKRFYGVYETPAEPIEMEVLTDRFEKQLDEKGLGTVDVDYTISLKGLAESRTTLSIEVR